MQCAVAVISFAPNSLASAVADIASLVPTFTSSFEKGWLESRALALSCHYQDGKVPSATSNFTTGPEYFHKFYPPLRN